MQRKYLAYIEMGLVMILVGNVTVIGKIITMSLPVFLASGLRFAIACLFFLPALYRERRQLAALRGKDWLMLFFQAFAGNFLYSILLLYGLRWTSALASGVITSTTPALVVLIALLFLKEKVDWQNLCGILLAVGGVLVINIADALSHTNASTNSLLGNILACGAVLGEALWIILSRYPVPDRSKEVANNTASPLVSSASRIEGAAGQRQERAYHGPSRTIDDLPPETGKLKPPAMAGLMCLFAFVLFLPFALNEARSVDFHTLPFSIWGLILYYGLATVIAYMLWFRTASTTPTSITGVFSGIVPISVWVFSFILLRETPNWSHSVGGLCVLCAIVLISAHPAQKRNRVDGYETGKGREGKPARHPEKTISEGYWQIRQ